MSWQDILAIIAVVIGTLSWIGIRPHQLARFFINRRTNIFRYIYYSSVSILTLLYLFVFVCFPLIFGIYDWNWGILSAIGIYFTIGIWLPLIPRQELWQRKLIRALTIISYVLISGILVGFWFFSWPEVVTPLTLTIIAGVIIIAGYIYNRLQSRKVEGLNTHSN